jgi:hypothetical protein
MSIPTPILYPDQTNNVALWKEDGVVTNADFVNGGSREVRVYFSEIDESENRTIVNVVDLFERDVDSLYALLVEQAGSDHEVPREYGGIQQSFALAAGAESMSFGGNGGGGDDPIKDIKGNGGNRLAEPGICTTGTESQCTAALDSLPGYQRYL